MIRRSLLILLTTLLVVSCSEQRSIRLATTTSVDNSGLLEPLLSEFERSTGIEVVALAVGSGQAMRLVRRGDADLMITHDPAGEQGFIDDQSPLLYRKIMCGRFTIAGPLADPAGVGSAGSAVEAMKRIALGDLTFASRGDRSGTHARELYLWSLAGDRPSSARLVETGQGMAATLRIASERQAYVLTDEATLAQLGSSLEIGPLFSERDANLLNCYAVTVPTGPRQDSSRRLAEWLTREEGRRLIDSFEIDGKRLFHVWPANVPDNRPDLTPE